MKVLLPSSIPLAVQLPDGVTSVVYDVHLPIPAEHRDAEVVVIWQSPAERLATMPAELTQLRWIQSLMAGTDAIEAAGFGPGVQLTSGRGLHDAPVAEHTLALILAAARRLDRTLTAQADGEWHPSQDANLPFGSPEAFTTLTGAHVLIWGFGGIGTRLAGYLSILGARVSGVARSAGDRSGYPVVTEAELGSVLPTTDVLVNILPATARTEGIVDAAVLAGLPERAWLVNVGRGATVVEEDLVQALSAGSIAGAALDVFATEPLPPSSPLWQAPNTILTPHSAGGRPQAPEALIEQNLRRLLAGEQLANLVS